MRRLAFGLIIGLLVCAYSQANMATMWFDRMGNAITERDYQGTYIVRGEDKLFAYYLQHTYKNNQSVERILQLDQDGIEIISNETSIIQVTPSQLKPQLTHISKPSPFSIFANLNSDQLLNNYEISLQPKERICGHQAIVLELNADQWRHSYRIWIEESSALPLKIAMVDSKNQTIEEYRFIDIEIKQQGEFVTLPTYEKTHEHSTIVSKLKQSDSWMQPGLVSPITWRPNNFVLVNSLTIHSGSDHYENYTYSDGLNNFSVFISNKTNNSSVIEESIKTMGATNILVTVKDQKLISILGEVPIQALQKIAQSVEFTDEEITP
ncbi:MucB/RseB C-terminal domain-containing protein [Marinicellulosiphila megalodicopiae]|uniref:MucB/RseB C-terminal domain-containing protein n=1 Tax=Marinicellulosiphila megalodicopiae TaxID=2724896 RepID=UPI003BAE34DF